MSDTWNRRRVLVGLGTLAAGTTGGIAVVSDNASATVDGEFTIPNSEAVLTDTVLEDVRLRADADWSYDANAKMHGVEMELHVGPSASSLDMIARHERQDIGTDSLAGEAVLSGSLVQSTPFSIDNFQPSSGTVTIGVVAELRLFVIRNGDAVATATQSESFDVTVSEKELEVSAGVSADGSVAFETATDTA